MAEALPSRRWRGGGTRCLLFERFTASCAASGLALRLLRDEGMPPGLPRPLLLVAALLAACADYPQSPPTPPSVPEIVADTPPPTRPPEYRIAEPAPRPGVAGARYVAAETRPVDCPGDEQPAIVGYQGIVAPGGDLTGHGLPIWQCFRGCGPGFEYITAVQSAVHWNMSRRHWVRYRAEGRHLVSDVRLWCAPACSPDTHRLTYSLAEYGEGCAAGAPPPDVAAALAAERGRLREGFAVRRAARVDVLVEQVHGLEAAPRPWDEATYLRYEESFRLLRTLDFDEQQAWDYAYARHDTRCDAQAVAFRKASPRLVTQTTGALKARLDKLASAGAAGERNHWKVVATSQCVDVCEGQWRHCHTSCRAMGNAACTACDVDRDKCEGPTGCNHSQG
jgi:hypothetical protein